MPVQKVFEGSVNYIQIIDKDGNVDRNLEPKIDPEMLKSLYRSMVLQRKWDRKNLVLQRTGRLFTYAPSEGQEAIVNGAFCAIKSNDWVFPTYRETFLYHLRGAPLWKVNLAWKGMEEGFKLEKSMRSFPAAVPIGTQLPYGTGAGYALKYHKEKNAVLVFGGDGSTSEGEFHDALNFAAVLCTPTVFLISNNGWAISLPRKLQTKSETIAQKALAYGMTGVQVDGNDVLAVYSVVNEALKKAREGYGPTLIEAVTYRMGPHTTADDPKKYRSIEEETQWRALDPIIRLQKYLISQRIWNEELEKQIDVETTNLVEKSVEELEKFTGNPKDIFKHVYEKMDPDLQNQMEECFGGENK